MLIAATGVGAGDLLTASLGGSAVGLTILWAAVAGAVLKWFLNEGIARWQMATGTTLLEGWVTKLGGWVQWVFLIYLLAWTFFTGGALITACGVAGTGLWPWSDDLEVSKRIWGLIHAVVGLVLVWFGGFRLFEKLMSVSIGLMFGTVMLTAFMARPDLSAVMSGLTRPSIPAGGMGWVLGILGGVGGTVTLLSYGYWIRERGREGLTGMRACRLDLGIAYTMTALFGVAMIIIGSRVDLEGKGASVAVALAGQLSAAVGPAGKWVFLAGFWGAVFSSLLGVWQGVPYLFADFLALRRGMSAEARRDIDYTRTPAYRAYLLALALVPVPVLWISVTRAQLAYAVLGSLFMPLLALTLLIMNNKRRWVGDRFRSGWITNAVLVITLLFFAYVGADQALRSAKRLIGWV
ncbi:MAG: Nramp family divalent metal transporter [Planctomycetes bacterium]|nr:Nramp family divalent metal transporter [Planctomycetota bacterium]